MRCVLITEAATGSGIAPGSQADRVRASPAEERNRSSRTTAVWRVPPLPRHGLNTRGKRLSLVAGYRAPYEAGAGSSAEPDIDVSVSGELVGWTGSSLAGFATSRP
jgi:hypothetical protein